MSKTLELITNSYHRLIEGVVEHFPYVVAGLIVLLAFFLAGRLISLSVRKVLLRGGRRSSLVLLVGRLITFGINILGILVAAVIIFPAFRPGDLVAALGLTSVAIGFAFKDILQNFFAGILILWRQPFSVGDEIRSGEFEGTVEEITTRSTRIKTYNGERAVIPNGVMYTNPVLVKTAFPTRRVQFSVSIGYGDSIERAREAILEVLRSDPDVVDVPEPWVQVHQLAPSSVDLMVYFWVPSTQGRFLTISDHVAEAIKGALDKASIEMPFPHRVVILRDERAPRPGQA